MLLEVESKTLEQVYETLWNSFLQVRLLGGTYDSINYTMLLTIEESMMNIENILHLSRPDHKDFQF